MRVPPLDQDRPPRSFDTNVQSIASAAHLRGVVLMRGLAIVGSVEARDLCRTLRAAHEATRGSERQRHVESLAGTLARRLGARGAVQVTQFHWNILTGYAKRHAPPCAKRGEVAPPVLSEAEGSRGGGVGGNGAGAHERAGRPRSRKSMRPILVADLP